MSVIVHYANQILLPRTGRPRAAHPALRRATPLQQAALEALGSFQAACPGAFQHVFHELKAPIVFTTAFGDLESYVRVASDIARHALPVSPLAFQHSVHNCATGYFSIVHGIDTPHLTFSSGYLSLDKALHFVFHRLSRAASGAPSWTHAVLLAADQCDEQGPHVAWAECIVLSSPEMPALPALAPMAILASIENTHAPHDAFFETESLRHLNAPPLGIADLALPCARRVRNHDGECVVSEWRKP